MNARAGSDPQGRAMAAALLAAAEGLHRAVRQEPQTVLRVLALRHDVADAVQHQLGAEQFHRLLTAMADEVCAYLRAQARQVKR